MAAMRKRVHLIEEKWGASAKDRIVSFPHLELVVSQVSARDIIYDYVQKTIKEIIEEGENTSLPASSMPQTRSAVFQNLGYLMRAKKENEIKENPDKISIKAEQQKAIEAFKNKQIFFMWNGNQVLQPDEMLDVSGENEARFIKLIALQGG